MNLFTFFLNFTLKEDVVWCWSIFQGFISCQRVHLYSDPCAVFRSSDTRDGSRRVSHVCNCRIAFQWPDHRDVHLKCHCYHWDASATPSVCLFKSSPTQSSYSPGLKLIMQGFKVWKRWRIPRSVNHYESNSFYQKLGNLFSVEGIRCTCNAIGNHGNGSF